MAAWVAQNARRELLEYWTGRPIDTPQALRDAIDENLLEFWYLLHGEMFLDRTCLVEPENH